MAIFWAYRDKDNRWEPKWTFVACLSWCYLRSRRQSGHLEGLAQLANTGIARGTILIVIEFADKSISETLIQ